MDRIEEITDRSAHSGGKEEKGIADLVFVLLWVHPLLHKGYYERVP
jgi:hypothetical protein